MNKIQKYFWITLLTFITPFAGHSNSARYEQLVKEKQELIAELEKCTNTTKGLKIAGVSTLGLTAVGIAGNIYEASVINKNDATITQQKQQKDELKKELQKQTIAAQTVANTPVINSTVTLTNTEETTVTPQTPETKNTTETTTITEQTTISEPAIVTTPAVETITEVTPAAETPTTTTPAIEPTTEATPVTTTTTVTQTLKTVSEVAQQDLLNFAQTQVAPGTTLYTQGYVASQLPKDLNEKFLAPYMLFLEKCLSLKGQNGIKSIDGKLFSYENDTSKQPLQADTNLTNLTKYEFATCVLKECEETTHKKVGNTCVAK